MQKRRSRRTIRRLETKFIADSTNYTGITSDLSEHGIFIRTRKGLAPGKIVELELYLPSGETLKLRGMVKRTIKTQSQAIKNGMGIELIDPSPKYAEFLKTLR